VEGPGRTRASVESGIYFVRARSDKRTLTSKLILVQ
jgi:hypothetical protein